MEKDDGGPAFSHDNQELGSVHRIAQPGMSLRDYFAGQALAAIATNPRIGSKDLAGGAYLIADAMLAERARAGEGK